MAAPRPFEPYDVSVHICAARATTLHYTTPVFVGMASGLKTGSVQSVESLPAQAIAYPARLACRRWRTPAAADDAQTKAICIAACCGVLLAHGIGLLGRVCGLSGKKISCVVVHQGLLLRSRLLHLQ